jgi:hypothetical protein
MIVIGLAMIVYDVINSANTAATKQVTYTATALSTRGQDGASRSARRSFLATAAAAGAFVLVMYLRSRVLVSSPQTIAGEEGLL